MWIYFLLILCLGGPNMTIKNYDAQDTGTDVTVTEWQGIRQTWFNGTNYFQAEMSDQNTGKIYKYNSDWSNKTEVCSVSVDPGGLSAVRLSCSPNIYYADSKYQAAWASANPINSKCKLVHGYSADGITWTTETIYTEAKPAGYIGITTLQIISIGTTMYYLVNGAKIIEPDGTVNTDSFSPVSYSGAYTDGSYLYWVSRNVTDTYSIRKWNKAGGFVELEAPPFASSSFAFSSSQYFVVGTTKIAALKGYLYYWYNASIGWLSVSGLGATEEPIVQWYLDGSTLKIRGFIYGDKYIQISTTGYITIIDLSVTFTTGSGWDDQIIGVDGNLYELGIYVNTDLLQINIEPIIEKEAEIRILSKTIFNEDQSIKIYNTADALQCQGNIANDEDNSDGAGTGSFQARIIPFIHWDLELKIDYTSSAAETVATAFANIITANFKFGSAGTLTSSATTYSFSIRAKPIREIFTELAHMDGKIWYCSASDQVYLDAGTVDSGTDILFNSGAGTPCGNIKKRSNNVKVGTVEYWGRDGSYIKSQSGTSNGYISDVMPSLNQDQITALAAATLSTNGTKVTEYIATEVPGIALFQIGQQIDFEQNYPPRNITSAKYYTKSMKFVLTQENYLIAELVLHDVLHFQTNQQITTEKVESHIRYVEEKVDNLAGGNYIFFLNNAASAVVATYKQLTYTNDASANEVSATITASGQVIEEWITENAVGVTILNKGQYEIHAQYKQGTVTGYKTGQVYWDLYKRTSGGTETLLGTTRTSNALTTSYAHQDLYIFLADDVAILATDRLVIKLCANISGSGNNPVVYITYGGTTYYSHLSFSGIATGVFAPLASPTFTTYARCDYTPSDVHDLTTKEYVDALDGAVANVSSFSNSWVNFDTTNYHSAGYWKVGSVVFLRGMIKDGTVGSGAFTLPAGYRPAKIFLGVCISNGGVGRIDIDTSGNVTPQTPCNNAYVSLNGISFRVN